MINIVILDDHQLFIDGLINSFSNDKEIHVVDYALDGITGLTKIKSLKPDLVVLDIDFTKTRENGIDILKEIKNYDRSIKVLVLTNYCEESLISILRVEGADGYRIKNIGFKELIETINDINQGQIIYKYDSMMVRRDSQWNSVPILSKRAVEIICLLSQGFIVKEIAQKLAIAESTVNDHLERAKRKLGVRNNCELVYIASKNKLI